MSVSFSITKCIPTGFKIKCQHIGICLPLKQSRWLSKFIPRFQTFKHLFPNHVTAGKSLIVDQTNADLDFFAPQLYFLSLTILKTRFYLKNVLHVN